MRFATLSLCLALFVSSVACAARTPLHRAQVAALTFGDIALEINQTEWNVYRSNVPGYDSAAHDKVGLAILKVIRLARGYERAVSLWPENSAVPQAVVDAKHALNVGLDDLVKALPALDAVRSPLNRVINTLVAAISDPKLSRQVIDADHWIIATINTHKTRGQSQPWQAEVPPIFAVFSMLVQLVAQGRIAVGRVREFLEKEGATPEELASLDAKLTLAEAERVAEHNASNVE